MSIGYKPITGVWEITMGCNMRCKHCGSSCENALEGELTTEEALKLCDDLKELGFEWITLSGGEPTTRKDWDLIAKRLNDNGIIPNMITNGWLMDDKIAKRAYDAGINTIAISLDGLQKTHDFIRKEGSYERIMKAFDTITSAGVNCSVITTINSINIHELDEMHEMLSKKGLFGWQLQLGLPMGNMAQNNDLISSPMHIEQVIDFGYRAMQKGGIEIQLADCIGYFDKKEIAIRKASVIGTGEYNWYGCGAGKYNLGILHNGDIVGCTSIRDRQFIEGNIKEKNIIDIWNDPEAFAWNRNLTKDKLNGLCKKCVHGARCLGGCGNTRLTMENSIYGENKYCSYNIAVSKATEQLSKISDVSIMMEKARKFADNNSFQLSEILLDKVLKILPDDEHALKLCGYVTFMLGNYSDCKAVNERLLKINPNDAYTNKGYGLSIARLGEVDRGIEHLRKSIELSEPDFMDPYHDLAVVLCENGRFAEAINILEKGRDLSTDFVEQSDELYSYLKTQI